MANIEFNYKDFEEAVEQTSQNIIALDAHYDYIVGIARGGLPFATRLSYKLDVPLVPVCWSTRDHEQKDHVYWLAEDIAEGKKVLVVDDILDSGECLSTLIEDWKDSVPNKENFKDNVSIAVLYYNVDQDIVPDFWYKTIERSKDKSWINFWWEK